MSSVPLGGEEEAHFMVEVQEIVDLQFSYSPTESWPRKLEPNS